MFNDDPAAMSVDERLGELASLLAAGFLRLKRRTGCLSPDERRTATYFNGSSGLPAAAPTNRSLAVAARTATCESAESSKNPADSPCHLSETSAPCAPR